MAHERAAVIRKGPGMDDQQYKKERLEDQITWYDSKSQWNQTRYKRLRFIEIAAAASIPFLIGFAEIVEQPTSLPIALRVLTALSGVVIAVITGVQSMCKYQENWMAYRTTCEMLKHEKYFYETSSGPYGSAENKLGLLVRRVEQLISQENTNWKHYMEVANDKTDA